jgi:hypothetical protein
MKLRHAGAFALMGWYLMSPPVMRIPRRGFVVNPAAGLGYWKIRGSYESSSDCDDAKGAILMLAADNPAKMPEDFSDLSPAVMSEVTGSLLCVSTGDPRLNSN